jgi:hypothetical protein
MTLLGVNILPDGIELLYDDGKRFVHLDKLSEHAPHLAAWLPVFVEVQGMIVRGAEAANGKA